MNHTISHTVRRQIATATIVVGTFLPLGAWAQGTPAQRAACTPDALRLCSSEIPDVARVTACMNANRAALSERCRAALPGAESHGPVVAAVSSPRRVAQSPHAVQRGAARPAHHVAYNATRPHRYRYAGMGGMFGLNSAQSAQAMLIARQVMTAVGSACGSQSLPPEVCSMSGNLMHSFAP